MMITTTFESPSLWWDLGYLLNAIKAFTHYPPRGSSLSTVLLPCITNAACVRFLPLGLGIAPERTILLSCCQQ
jgi:hypothetical protein